MLTRIEIDGFKSFESFSMDLRPLAVVMGGNAVGKSNLFDAIHFVSCLGTMSVADACAAQRRGLPAELFTMDAAGIPRQEMSLAVEVLLQPNVTDPFGTSFSPTRRRLRWEITLQRETTHGLERVVVARERVTQPSGALWDSEMSASFKKAYAGSGKSRDFLVPDPTDPRRALIKQDGHQGRDRPVAPGSTTVLNTITTATEFQHLFALREEVANWRFLHLDPAEMRDPSRHHDAPVLARGGRNLASALFSLQQRTSTEERPAGVLSDVAAELRKVVPAVRDVRVTSDASAREFRVELDIEGRWVNARLVSDGTIRLLALFSQLFDPDFRGLLYLEEPENGIHPERLRRLVGVLRDRVSDPTAASPAGEPWPSLRQILINSHSPVVLSALQGASGEVFFAEMVRVPDPRQPGSRVSRTRIRPVVDAAGDPHQRRRVHGRPARGAAVPRHRDRRRVMRELRALLFTEGRSDVRFLEPLVRRLLEQLLGDAPVELPAPLQVVVDGSKSSKALPLRVVDALAGALPTLDRSSTPTPTAPPRRRGDTGSRP